MASIRPTSNIPARSNSKSTNEVDALNRRRTLTPTGLAQYLSVDSCDRFLKFYLYKGETDELARRLRTKGLQRALQPFGPLLAKLGDRVETKVIEGLQAQGHTVIDMSDKGPEETLAFIKKIGSTPVYLYQADVAGKLGQWQFAGKADLIRLRLVSSSEFQVSSLSGSGTSENYLEILVGDVKSTRKDKVYHRLQVAVYVRMLQNMLVEGGVELENCRFLGTVVRRNADGTLQDPETAPRFDLDPYFLAIDQLAIAPDSALARVDAAKLEDLHYHYNQRCDGCLFNPICMVESNERKDIALIPFLESADKRVLVEHGIRTIPDLAGLKQFQSDKSKVGSIKSESLTDNRLPTTDYPSATRNSLTTTPGKEAIVATLSEKWPVGPKLDRLVQRAARVMNRQFDPNVTSLSYFLDAGRSVLPDDKQYPDMVKIFLDVQTDYLEDRVYLAGARINGPKGSRSIVKMTEDVPQAESERELLLNWVAGIFEAVCEVAEDMTATPVHLYLYNRHDQKALLNALRRHLNVFASIPALYELLTETPALTQSAVSFVYDEVKERSNLANCGHSLQSVATQMGFKWNDGDDLRYFRLFAQGMFDYLLKLNDGRWIESAARFYSSIPLEYAYAAWGMFKAEDFLPKQRGGVSPYLKVDTEQLKLFQAKRLEAIAYIESQFKFKNSRMQKEPLDLTLLGSSTGTLPPFRRVLEEFLYIEHYANLQEHLQLFSQPIVKRVQLGRALLLRCVTVEEANDKKGQLATTARFEADFSETGLEPSAALQLNKLKSGDFVVLNGLETDGRAWDMLHGRLCVIRSLQGAILTLSLTNMTFSNKNSETKILPFRYSHDNKLRPVPGEFYLLDEMVDDLNGDKLLEACQYADFNPFYHRLTAKVGSLKSQVGINPQLATRNSYLPTTDNPSSLTTNNFFSNNSVPPDNPFLTLIDALEGKNKPTERQREVIAGRQETPVFLVQGPPGTGKSHTLGWAVLARMYQARAEGKALRVAVVCHTHNAINIVLQSIAGKLARLEDTQVWPYFQNLRLFKIGGEDNTDEVSEIEPLDVWEQRRNLGQILGSELVVIGGTPGGLHKLMKERTRYARSPKILWQEKAFDLVILDEASQMNLPQALLASAWLRENGQLIVVGDHRQMSPILAHSWDDEDRLSAMNTQPYRSVFQYLVDLDFPRVALDESFRLHKVQAEFLHHNIYEQDGIIFHSRRQQLLEKLRLTIDDLSLDEQGQITFTNNEQNNASSGNENNPLIGNRQSSILNFLMAVLDPLYPVIVVQHEERGSQQANPTEAELIGAIVAVCTEKLGLEGSEGIGVVVPHRAQKALLRDRFPQLAASDAIDTVERFQGDEREVIIVSATASDPDYVLAEAEFLLNPNRLNVALSRPRKKLIVVASSVVFKFLSADLEIFEQAVLWKRLLTQCADELLWSGELAGTQVRVFGKRA